MLPALVALIVSSRGMGDFAANSFRGMGDFPHLLAMACEPGSFCSVERYDTKEERMIISLLDQATNMSFEDYNPAYVIQAVNVLQPLGKEKALEQIDSCLENRDKSQYAYGLFWVLRVLFEVPVGQGFPPVRMGTPSIPPPAEPAKLPRFPIVMVQDIPFLAVRGYYLRGLPEPVEAHVAYFREHGIILEHPLAPPESITGIEEKFLQRWKAAYGDAYTTQVSETIKSQIARIGGR